MTLLIKTQPDEFYNLAAQSHVHTSFELPVYTSHVDGIGTLNCLEAIRQAGLAGKTKFYQVFLSVSVQARVVTCIIYSGNRNKFKRPRWDQHSR